MRASSMNYASLKAICTSVPGRYASALFEVAKESNTLEETLEECTLAQQLLSKGQPYRILFIRILQGYLYPEWLPKLQEAVKTQDFMVRFLKLLATNNRISCLPDITRILSMLIDHELNRVSLTVYSAEPLNAPDEKRLETKLLAIFQKKIITSYQINPSILGGIIIKSDNIAIDISLKHQIEQFSKIAKSYFNGDINESQSC